MTPNYIIIFKLQKIKDILKEARGKQNSLSVQEEGKELHWIFLQKPWKQESEVKKSSAVIRRVTNSDICIQPSYAFKEEEIRTFLLDRQKAREFVSSKTDMLCRKFRLSL